VLVDTLRGRVFDIWGYNSTPGLFIKPPKPFCWYANGLSISSSGLYPSDIIGIGGSNVSFFNGAVWPEEIIAGEIKHPLKCWLPRKCIRYNFYCPPLTSSEKDQQTNHPYSIPEGTRLQLNPSINLDAYPLNHTEKVIARALQKYGMYLVDTNDPTLNGVVKSGLTILAVSGRSYLQNPYRLVPGFPPDLISNSHQYNYSFSNTFIELMKHLRIILAPVLPTADRVARSAINGSVMEYCN
ncbi:MAG: hypothetical protein N2747_04370, partial [Chitinophagaceae bacterium]|nr:hypothetical protein [Chitinophagaceae bacterium]